MTKNQLDLILKDCAKHVKRWKPVLSSQLGVENNTVVELLACYCEYYETLANQQNIHNPTMSSMTSGMSYGYGSSNPNPHNHKELGQNLVKILTEINKLPAIRSKVEHSPYYYNALSHRFEYKLDNGEYVTANETPGKYSGELTRAQIISAFPEDFVKLLDMSEYRDMRINSLIC
jgi:hypothetical protein